MVDIADMVRLGYARLTAQQVADMALCEDRMARAARARGDDAAFTIHSREADRLAALIATGVV